MKNIITCFLLSIVLVVSVHAQQNYMFTQYLNNELVINPAYAGSHESMSVTALYRHQWVGIDGAPKTFSFSGHTNLSEKSSGLGFMVVNDKIGISNHLDMYGIYSYRLKLTQRSNLRFGLQLGLTNYHFNTSTLNLQQTGDDNLEENVGSTMKPNFGAGIYYSSRGAYVGLSIPKLILSDIEIGGSSLLTVKRHLFISGGFVKALSKEIKWKPTTLVKLVEAAPVEVDISSSFIYQNKYWLGLAYRSFDSIDILAAVQATPQLKIGYSYDMTLTRLKSYNSGSHEILINYRFSFENDRIISPRFF